MRDRGIGRERAATGLVKVPRARATRSRLTSAPVDNEARAEATTTPRRRAAGRKVLSTEALDDLGAPKLMGVAERDPAVARSLRLALAGTESAGRLAAELEKRLRTLQRTRGFVEWDKVRPLAQELDGLRQTITGALAESARTPP